MALSVMAVSEVEPRRSNLSVVTVQRLLRFARNDKGGTPDVIARSISDKAISNLTLASYLLFAVVDSKLVSALNTTWSDYRSYANLSIAIQSPARGMEEVMLDFSFTEAQQELIRMLRVFVKEELAPRYAEGDRTGAFPFVQWKKMAELGLTGLHVPAEYDGQEADCVTVGIAAEEIARGDFNCGYAILMTDLIGEVLSHHASPELKKAWLAPMARGERIIGLALTEAGGGSDAAAITTRAVRDGDDYILSGEKSGISMAMASDAFVVFAKTGPTAGARGVSAFLVPADSPGFSRTPYQDMGQRCMQRGSLFLDEVRIPITHRIGEEGKGFSQVMAAFDYSRILIALMCLGVAEQSLEETMEYVKTRQAFGRPLAKFEGVSFPIAEHATMLEAAKWLCYRGLWLKDQRLPHTKEGAMCKWFVPKLAVEVIHSCLLLHGHYGYTKDLPFEQRLRDVLGLEIGDGTAQIQKIVVARELMGREYLPYR
jgi:cyclohexanecarboxyl-CoA dehydrogenase